MYMNVLSDWDNCCITSSTINGTFSFDALFLFENFQTDILQGTAEGRSSILISTFDWVCLKIGFTKSGNVCRAAPRYYVLSDRDNCCMSSISGTFSFDALFLLRNFQTYFKGTAEGRSWISISSFDWVCLKIDFTGFLSRLSRCAVRERFLSSRNLSLNL